MGHERLFSNYLSRYRLIPATLHALIFAIVWLIAAFDPKPLFDGNANLGFSILLYADFPFSVIGFSMMWDKRFLIGSLIWGVGGTILWYMLGFVFFNLKRIRPK